MKFYTAVHDIFKTFRKMFPSIYAKVTINIKPIYKQINIFKQCMYMCIHVIMYQ